MLYFIKQNKISPNALSVFEVEETKTLVKRNMEALMQMRSLVATAEHCVCDGTCSQKPFTNIWHLVSFSFENDDCSRSPPSTSP
jgi:hypothetical protein